MAATPGGSIATPQAAQRQPSVLVGAFGRSGRQAGGDFHALGKLGPADYACRTFYITPGGFGRGATTDGNRCHGAFEFDSSPYERHHVAGAQFTGRFHSIAIDMNFATGDGLGGQGTGLEQAHAKKPPVYAGGSRTFIGTIFGHGREYN